jgi:MFS family permease
MEQQGRNDRPPVWRQRNVLALGVVSLLTDAASEMVLPLLPAFLTTVLGAGARMLGWIEGMAELVASVLKLLSGRWADRTGRNRPFVVAGYGLASVVRPLVGLATAPWHVLAVRVTDRVGKGLRTSPRDALLAASVPAAQRGAAFGFHRAMDHAGAFIGPLVAFLILTAWTEDLRVLFLMSAVPSALVLLVVIAGVRDRPAEPAAATRPVDESRSQRSLVGFLVPLGLFNLGRVGDVFLMLKAGATHAPLYSLPLLWMALHLVKAVTSLQGGRLADRWGSRPTVAVGWLVAVVAYVGFAFAETQAALWGLFLVYGAHQGLSEAAEKSLVAGLARAPRRGTGFGWYHLTLGLLSLAGYLLFGHLWDAFGGRTAFLTSAVLGAAGLTLLALRRDRDVA